MMQSGKEKISNYYLFYVLQSGAKSFLYRNRIRLLLGMPDSDRYNIRFPQIMRPVGFRYENHLFMLDAYAPGKSPRDSAGFELFDELQTAPLEKIEDDENPEKHRENKKKLKDFSGEKKTHPDSSVTEITMNSAQDKLMSKGKGPLKNQEQEIIKEGMTEIQLPGETEEQGNKSPIFSEKFQEPGIVKQKMRENQSLLRIEKSQTGEQVVQSEKSQQPEITKGQEIEAGKQIQGMVERPPELSGEPLRHDSHQPAAVKEGVTEIQLPGKARKQQNEPPILHEQCQEPGVVKHKMSENQSLSKIERPQPGEQVVQSEKSQQPEIIKRYEIEASKQIPGMVEIPPELSGELLMHDSHQPEAVKEKVTEIQLLEEIKKHRNESPILPEKSLGTGTVQRRMKENQSLNKIEKPQTGEQVFLSEKPQQPEIIKRYEIKAGKQIPGMVERPPELSGEPLRHDSHQPGIVKEGVAEIQLPGKTRKQQKESPILSEKQQASGMVTPGISEGQSLNKIEKPQTGEQVFLSEKPQQPEIIKGQEIEAGKQIFHKIRKLPGPNTTSYAKDPQNQERIFLYSLLSEHPGIGGKTAVQKQKLTGIGKSMDHKNNSSSEGFQQPEIVAVNVAESQLNGKMGKPTKEQIKNLTPAEINSQTNRQAVFRIEQLRREVHRLKALRSNTSSSPARDNLDIKEDRPQTPAPPVQPVTIVKQLPTRLKTRLTACAFWERSYLSRFHLRTLR